MKAKMYTQPDSSSNQPHGKCLLAISFLLVTTCVMLFQSNAFSQTPKEGGDTLVTADSVKMNEGLMPALAKRTSRFAFENPHPTRYFFAPSAIPLQKGEGYYQNVVGILMNTANYGVTDHFSIGGGLVLPVGFIANFKVGYQISDWFYLGAGAINLSIFWGDILSVGALFGSVTFGNTENNITVSSGLFGHNLDWEFEISKRPSFNVGGMFRLSDNISLISENWLFPEKEHDYQYNQVIGLLIEKTRYTYIGLLMNGLRIMGEKHSLDFAAILPFGMEAGILLIPYIDYVFKF